MVRPFARPSAHGATVAVLTAVLVLVVFLNSWGTFTTDTKPEVYLAPGRMLGEYLSAWTFSPYLGAPSFNGGLSAVAAVTGLLSLTGLSPELVFKVFHLALWLVAAVGASALGRRLDPRMGRRGGLVVAIVYLANPYAVTAGATLPVLLPLAWLPWQLLTLVRAAEAPTSWRWPALFGLSFFLMSGINAGVVPVLCLLAVVPTMVYLKGRCELSGRQVVVIVARCALFVVWVSLYWLVPSLSAASTGSTIVQGTESYDVIAGVSSFSEVLRGLGLWPLYGSDNGVPWVQEHAVYLTSWVLVLATFVAAALALVSLADVPRRLARYLVATITLAVVVMVGLHPSGSSSPFGRAMRWLFDTVPVLSAFRTTNKIGAVLVLAFALAAGIVLRVWWGRVTGRVGRTMLVGGGGVLVVLVALPAFTGHLYTSPVDVPGYWDDAASTMDAEDPGDRVLVLPGTVSPHYRWSEERPDDILNSVFSRPTFTPVTVANTSAEGVNFTAALDDTFQSATARGPYTSTFARYVGATDVLLRHDLAWEDRGGIRPGQVQRSVATDDGLVPARNFGAPGENVTSPTIPPEPFYETDVPPLQQYRVSGSTGQVRAERADDQLVVAGDGWSVPSMTRRGLLATGPTFRYAQDLSDDDWDSVLGKGHRLLLTDTNRRRNVIPNRLVAGQGPLLRPDQELRDGSRTLGDDASDQTVLRVDGGRVTASRRGYAFFDTPWGTAENAFDDDPSTAWVVGDYGRAVGQHVQLDLDVPRDVPRIELTESVQGPVRLDRVTVRAGGRTRTVQLDDDGTTSIELGARDAGSVRVTVDSIRGTGINSPGIAEITVPGVRVDRVAVLPRTFDTAYRSWSGQRRSAFGATPLDVLLTRVQGGQSDADDEERSLKRSFSLPDARRFGASATIRLQSSAEGLYDRIEGIAPAATSSGQWFYRPDLRASMAFDDDPATGWAPDVTQGASIRLSGKPRQLSSITLDQQILPGGFETSWARRVEVRADGRSLTVATVEPGRNTIALTLDGSPVTVGDLEITVVQADPAGQGITPPLFTDIDAGSSPGRVARARRCVQVGDIDGRPLHMRPVDGASPAGSSWVLCNTPVEAAAGLHELRATVPGVVVDSLDLVDTLAVAPSSAPEAIPELAVERGTGATMTITPSARNDKPYLLVIGEGYDSRWRASIGGRDLGTPIVVDGYSTAWLVDPADGSGPVTVFFAPQRTADAALVASGLGLLVVGWLGAVPSARRRWAGLDRGLTRVRGRVDALPRPSWAQLRPAGAVPSRPRRWSPWPPATKDRARRLVVPQRVRPAAGWSALVAAAFVLASWAGLIAAAVLAAVVTADRSGRFCTPRRLVRLGAALVLVSGVVWLFAIGDMRGTVTPALVTDHPWPSWLAAGGLVTVVVGVWRRHDEP